MRDEQRPRWATAARLAADVMGVPTLIVARTDAEAADLVTRGVEATFAESEETATKGPGGKLYVTYDIARQFRGYGAEAGAGSSDFADRIIHHLKRM